MDTHHLVLFADVVRLGSMAATARHHRVDPSKVSRAIAALEHELGVCLLQRTTRRHVLTDAGQRYLERVGPLLADLEEAREVAKDATAEIKGGVRATVPVSYAMRRIVPKLPDFRRQYPAIQLDLVMSDARLALVDDRLDLAVRLGRLDTPGLVARKLHDTPYRVVASPAYLARRGTPTSLSALRDHDTMVFPLSATDRWRFRTAAGEASEVVIHPHLRISNTLALRDACVAGMGVTVLADWVVDDVIATGDLVVLLDNYEVAVNAFDAAAWLVYPSRRFVPARVRAFADWLVARTWVE